MIENVGVEWFDKRYKNKKHGNRILRLLFIFSVTRMHKNLGKPPLEGLIEYVANNVEWVGFHKSREKITMNALSKSKDRQNIYQV